MKRYSRVKNQHQMVAADDGMWVKYEDAIAHGIAQYEKGMSVVCRNSPIKEQENHMEVLYDDRVARAVSQASTKGVVHGKNTTIDNHVEQHVLHAPEYEVPSFSAGGFVHKTIPPLMGEQGSEAISPEVTARNQYEDVVDWLMGESDQNLAQLIVDTVGKLRERELSVNVSTCAPNPPAPWDDTVKEQCVVTLTRKVSSQ